MPKVLQQSPNNYTKCNSVVRTLFGLGLECGGGNLDSFKLKRQPSLSDSQPGAPETTVALRQVAATAGIRVLVVGDSQPKSAV